MAAILNASDKAQIARFIGGLHIGETDEAISRKIRRRIRRLNPLTELNTADRLKALENAYVAFAIEVHHRNTVEYHRVMRGFYK